MGWPWPERSANSPCSMASRIFRPTSDSQYFICLCNVDCPVCVPGKECADWTICATSGRAMIRDDAKRFLDLPRDSHSRSAESRLSTFGTADGAQAGNGHRLNLNGQGHQ